MEVIDQDTEFYHLQKSWEIKEFSEQWKNQFKLCNYCQTANNYAETKTIPHEV